MTSCPDWKSLAAHRYARDGAEPPGWAAALEHLRSCGACSQSAVQADPTLLFVAHATPVPNEPETGLSLSEVDIADMQRAVRRERRIGLRDPATADRRRWLSAAAGVMLAILGIAYGLRDSSSPSVSTSPAAGSDSKVAVSASTLPPELEQMPLVEGLDGEARIYQVAASELDLVVIVGDWSERSGGSLDL